MAIALNPEEFSRVGFETTAAHQTVILAPAKRVHPLGMRHVTNFSRLEAPLTQLLDMDIGPTDQMGEEGRAMSSFPKRASENGWENYPRAPPLLHPHRRLIKCPLA